MAQGVEMPLKGAIIGIGVVVFIMVIALIITGLVWYLRRDKKRGEKSGKLSVTDIEWFKPPAAKMEENHVAVCANLSERIVSLLHL